MPLHILSVTGIAKRPFYIKSTGLRIWSVEELCFFLEHNLSLVDSEIANTHLTRWLSEEFRLTSLAVRMEKGLEKENGFSDFLLPLFSETAYFSGREMKTFAEGLKRLEEAPFCMRCLEKADALTRNRLYGEALEYYRRAEETADRKDAVFAAVVLHNAGVAASRLLEYDEALKFFRRAYELDGSDENLKTYLTAYRLTKPAAVFRGEAEKLSAPEEMVKEIDTALYAALEKNASAKREWTEEELSSEVRRLREEYHREAGV